MAFTQMGFEEMFSNGKLNQPRTLSNIELHESLRSSIRCEMRLMGYIVELICEIDCRRLYLEFGCTSLFAYLTEVAGYTAAPAQARIDAARLLSDVPTIAEDLKDGSLNLTQVSLVARSIRQKVKEAPTHKPTAQEKREIFEAIKARDVVQSQKLVAEKLDIEVKTFELKSIQQDGSLRAEMTFSHDELQQINRLKELLSHSLPGASIQDALMAAAADYLKRNDPLTKQPKPKILKDTDGALSSVSAVLSGPQSASALEITSKSEVFEPNSRPLNVGLPILQQALPPARSHISRPIKRSIHKRDQCCQWRDQFSGKTCGSRFQLQVDHIEPVWAGGTNEIGNLQLLCATHNRMKYRREAGIVFRY